MINLTLVITLFSLVFYLAYGQYYKNSEVFNQEIKDFLSKTIRPLVLEHFQVIGNSIFVYLRNVSDNELYIKNLELIGQGGIYSFKTDLKIEKNSYIFLKEEINKLKKGSYFLVVHFEIEGHYINETFDVFV